MLDSGIIGEGRLWLRQKCSAPFPENYVRIVRYIEAGIITCVSARNIVDV